MWCSFRVLQHSTRSARARESPSGQFIAGIQFNSLVKQLVHLALVDVALMPYASFSSMMSEGPSMAGDDMQVLDMNWSDILDVDEDVSVFDGLGLDEALPHMGTLPLTYHCQNGIQPVESHDCTPAAQQHSSTDSAKLARTRARNREAQSRYRQKAKVLHLLLHLLPHAFKKVL